ncbi:MAG: methyltransferase family protein [Promethearchaeota archaeon]
MRDEAPKREIPAPATGLVPRFSNHSNRPDLGGEPPHWDAIQGFLLAMFLPLWAVDSFFLHLTTVPAGLWPSVALLGVALVLLAAGVYLVRTGIRDVFSEYRDPPRVLVAGLYSRCRHPVYLGVQLLYVAAVISTRSLLAAGVWVLVFLVYERYATREEEMMVEKFGEEFLQYAKSVPKWLPKFGKRPVPPRRE